MGRVLGPFGIKGWVRIAPFTEAPDGLRQFPVWWLGSGQDWREFRLAESARHGKFLVARFQGCDSPEVAAQLRGREVAVPREALPPGGENEFYQADLIGLEVRNVKDERLGLVESFLNNGAHEVMRVVDEGGERLLPFIPSVVKMVDTGTGCIVVDWEKDW